MARLTGSKRRAKQALSQAELKRRAEARKRREEALTKARDADRKRNQRRGTAKPTSLFGGGTKKSTTTTAKKKTKHASPYKTTEQKNREMFGDKHIDALKIKHSEWKKARKEGTLKEWEKKYKPKKKRRMGVDPSEY